MKKEKYLHLAFSSYCTNCVRELASLFMAVSLKVTTQVKLMKRLARKKVSLMSS